MECGPNCVLTNSISSCTPKNGHAIGLKIIGDSPINAGVTRLSPTASLNGNKWSTMGTARNDHTIAISSQLRDGTLLSLVDTRVLTRI